MMKKGTRTMLLLALASVVLMSLPFLVKGCGPLALVGLVPLLAMERLAALEGRKHFWWWHYGVFVLWNAVTTWWVCNATVGGGVFAVLANALQMSLVFGSFRWVKRRLGGALPYLYLASAWIAWEKYYLTIAQISWPWLVLGNAFADTTSLIQWYEFTGHLGGSLWVWASNLAVFGLMVTLSDGRYAAWNAKARLAAVSAAVLVFLGPMVWSLCLRPRGEGEAVRVVIAQPNLDPYEKFESLTQEEQNDRLLNLLDQASYDGAPTLALAPETFTSDILTGEIPSSPTFHRFQAWLQSHPGVNLVFGASAHDRILSVVQPHPLAYQIGDVMVDGKRKHVWVQSRNSAILTDSTGRHEIFHKSKLVVGVEMTPYPKLFQPLEKLLGGNLMGRCIGQAHPTTLHFHSGEQDFPLGCAVCYESVFGEYCTGYVREGAALMTVITNDAWWGDTPGYRQHLNYSRLRAIELRRDIARCANTGISALIDREGRIVARTSWWEPALLEGRVHLSEEHTFFVRYGDITGRIAVFLWILLGAGAIVSRLRRS